MTPAIAFFFSFSFSLLLLNNKKMNYQQQFEIVEIDRDGKKFDRVSRINATSDTLDDLVLDINTEIFPVSIADKLNILLTANIGADGWRVSKNSIANDYDYVCHGKVYKDEDSDAGKASLYVSFGGLLMCLSASSRQLDKFVVGTDLFLLVRK